MLGNLSMEDSPLQHRFLLRSLHHGSEISLLDCQLNRFASPVEGFMVTTIADAEIEKRIEGRVSPRFLIFLKHCWPLEGILPFPVVATIRSMVSSGLHLSKSKEFRVLNSPAAFDYFFAVSKRSVSAKFAAILLVPQYKICNFDRKVAGPSSPPSAVVSQSSRSSAGLSALLRLFQTFTGSNLCLAINGFG
jgi:hypothetical protein